MKTKIITQITVPDRVALYLYEEYLFRFLGDRLHTFGKMFEGTRS